MNSAEVVRRLRTGSDKDLAKAQDKDLAENPRIVIRLVSTPLFGI